MRRMLLTPFTSKTWLGLTLKISDWKSWTYTNGSYHIQEGKTIIWADVFHPSSGNSVELNQTVLV